MLPITKTVYLVWLLLLLPCLFKVRPLVLSKTLSQMWDRLHLPYLPLPYLHYLP